MRSYHRRLLLASGLTTLCSRWLPPPRSGQGHFARGLGRFKATSVYLLRWNENFVFTLYAPPGVDASSRACVKAS
eukprot:6291463-Pyramimonas_sp.AAC.1